MKCSSSLTSCFFRLKEANYIDIEDLNLDRDSGEQLIVRRRAGEALMGPYYNLADLKELLKFWGRRGNGTDRRREHGEKLEWTEGVLLEFASGFRKCNIFLQSQ